MSKNTERQTASWIKGNWAHIMSTIAQPTDLSCTETLDPKVLANLYYIGRHDALSYKHNRATDIALKSFVQQQSTQHNPINDIVIGIYNRDAEQKAESYYNRGYIDAIMLLHTNIDPIPTEILQFKPSGYTDPPKISEHQYIERIRTNPAL